MIWYHSVLKQRKLNTDHWIPVLKQQDWVDIIVFFRVIVVLCSATFPHEKSFFQDISSYLEVK